MPAFGAAKPRSLRRWRRSELDKARPAGHGRLGFELGGGVSIGIGIVGGNFGADVLLPAFRADPRAHVVGLCSANAEKAREIAAREAVEAFGDWKALIADPRIRVVAVATPPALQPDIAIAALRAGKAVFAEKPLGRDRDAAQRVADAARETGQPVAVDFEFPEIAAWTRAKALLDQGAIGALRHVIVNWHVENAATRLNLRTWKTSRAEGGGVLGNFASHSFYYLEWLCGPIASLSAQLDGRADDPDDERTGVIALRFASGAAGGLTVSAASFLGSGHRLEFYGEDGTLVLSNVTQDYARGFVLSHGDRESGALAQIDVVDAFDARFPDGRIAPAARIAARLLDSVERGDLVYPNAADGLRVQHLIDAARKSSASSAVCEVAP